MDRGHRVPVETRASALVFITDRWGYKRGGINVFNTDICSAMVEVLQGESVQVMCVVQSASAQDKEHAAASGVELLVLETFSAEEVTITSQSARELVALINNETEKSNGWWF